MIAKLCKKVFKKFFEKSFKKIWKLEKLALPLHHFRAYKTAESWKTKVLKNFWKKFQKDLVVWKKYHTFAPLSRLERREGENRKIRATAQSNRISFFEVIEQLNKFFPSLRKKRNFKNNTFEIRAMI